MLSPNTAACGCSIWDVVGQEIFETHAGELFQTDYAPSSYIHDEADWPEQTEPDAQNQERPDSGVMVAAISHAS